MVVKQNRKTQKNKILKLIFDFRCETDAQSNELTLRPKRAIQCPQATTSALRKKKQPSTTSDWREVQEQYM